MKNADKPISPCLMQKIGDTEYRANKYSDPKEFIVPCEGLTKREYFAAMAMQGLSDRIFTDADHVWICQKINSNR